MRNICPFLLFVLLIALGCDKEDVQPVQTYNIQVVDSLDVPISGIEGYLSHAIGSTYPLGGDRGLTDANGTLVLNTNIHLDTVQAILARENWDETFWHQIIGVEAEEYLLHSIFQNGIDKTAARRKVEEDDLITIQLLTRGILRLRYRDGNALNDVSYISLKVTGVIGNASFLYEMDQPIGLFDNDQFALYVPSKATLNVAWSLYSGEFLNGTLEKSGMEVIRIETNEESAVDIER